MGWETRGGKRYYYRAAKVNGRVVKTYIGTGEVAETAARLDESARAARSQKADAKRAALNEIAETERLLKPFYDLVDDVVAIVMEADGYHFSKGRWRKKRAGTVAKSRRREPIDLLAAAEALERATVAAEQGAQRAAGGQPAAWRAPTDPTNTVLEQEVAKAAGTDETERAAARARVEAKRTDLAGPRPELLVSMVADRAALQWFRLQRFDRPHATADPPDPRARDAVHRRCSETVNLLAKLIERQARRDRPYWPGDDGE